MKKLFILCLAAIMTTSFFSCGNSSKENSKKDKTASSQSEQSEKTAKTQKKDDNKALRKNFCKIINCNKKRY